MEWLRSDVVLFYITVVFLSWKFAWSIIYQVSGIHVSRIGFSNGFVVSGITIKNKHTAIQLHKLRIRLWGSSKIILEDLEIEILQNPTKDNKRTSKSSQVHSNENLTLNILPNRAIPRFVAKFVIRHIPRTSIEFRNTTINYSRFTYKLDILSFLLKSKYTKRYNDAIKVYVDIRTLNIVQIITNPLLDSALSLLSISNSNVGFNFSIPLKTGELKDARFQLFISGFRLSVFNAIKILLENNKNPTPCDQKSGNSNREEMKFSERLQKLGKVASYIREISVHFENADLYEIPFATTSENVDFNSYFKKDKLNACLNLNFKAATINFQKLISSSAGFSIMFDTNKDIPFHITSSIQLLNLNYVLLDYQDSGQYSKTKDEILNVPNCSFTFKANLLYQLLEGNGFKDFIIEFYSSASSPILDLDTIQLSELIYNFILLRKYFKLRELRTRSISQKNTEYEYEYDESVNRKDMRDDVLNEKTSVTINSFWNLLNDYYPHLDMKLVIEQPRIIVKHKSHNKTGILNYSYSLLNFQISTSKTRDYNAICHILHPSISYESVLNNDFHTRTREEIFGIEVITLNICVLKNLKLDSTLEIKSPSLVLSKLETLRGINSISTAITNLSISQLNNGILYLVLNSEIMEQPYFTNISELKQGDDINHKMFKALPRWLLKTKIKISSLNILLGSTSILLPKESIHDDALLEFNDISLNTKCTIENIIITLTGKHEDSPLEYPSDSSQETLASIDRECSWNVDGVVSRFNVSVKTSKETSFQSIISIPSIMTSVSAIRSDSNNYLNSDLHIDHISGSYDRYKIFTVIGALYLMKEYILFPMLVIRKKIKYDLKKVPKASKLNGNSLLSFFHLNLVLDDFQYVFHLSDDFKVKLQLFNTIFTFSDMKTKIVSNFIRLLTDSPMAKGKWNRILCADSLKLSINDPKYADKINLKFDDIRFMHPHQLVVYKLFDNLSITLKIVKHLIKCLNKDTQSKPNIVMPKTTNALNVPDIKLTANNLSFVMDDDPFECELNMIFQLGLVEQKKRLELYSLWESKAVSSEFSEEDILGLQNTISRSWIRKVKAYKQRISEEIHRNKTYLFGNEIFVEKKNNKRIVPYMIQPPLLTVSMTDVNLNVMSTKFKLSDVPKFISKMGQGVPMDSKYTTLIPLFLKLGISELRMHLRDYPLPLLYVPKNRTSSEHSLLLSGHFIISEALCNKRQHLRELIVPLVPSLHQTIDKKFYTLEIQKSLATVKMFFDLDVKFNSSNASRFVWGQSYQFGLQQALLNLDQFSKPPVDTSMKLGIWDKIRLIMHGKFAIQSDSKLEIAFKGSRNPYSLFDTSSGFILAFDENVVWQINENDDSRNFFEAKSESASWYIPNYLATPMLSWSRPSSSFIYLPHSRNFISSCFAYYLDETARSSNKNLPVEFIEKNMIKLHGGVNFKVGFVLQRNGKDERGAKPHYLVNLFNPKFTESDHDSYKGFRSDFIHMAITLIASNESCYNAIHLSPNTFFHFFNWWKLFNGNMQLPIRNGNIFGDIKKSIKFSQHLVSNTFQFKIKSLFISHIYRDEDDANNKIECTGLRAKMDDFMVDLHQKKEPRIEIHEELSRSKQIKKMNFGQGEVHLSGIDLRSVSVSFESEDYPFLKETKKKSIYKIHDNDKQWFDLADYEEAFSPSLNSRIRNVSINPLLYSEQFSYLRESLIDPKQFDTSSVIQLFGDVHTHVCFLQSKNVFAPQIELYESRIKQLKNQITINNNKGVDSSQLKERISSLEKDILETQKKWESMIRRVSNASKLDFRDHFHNRFILIGMLLKWNAKNRNIILRYIHFIQLFRSLRQYLSYESIAAIEKLIESAENVEDDISTFTNISIKEKSPGIGKFDPLSSITSRDRLMNFDQILRKVKLNERIREDYMIEIISPQIQLQSDLTSDSVVLISAPTIDAKIMSVIEKNKNDHLFVNAKELEVRFGIVLRDASIFILKKEDVINSDKLLLSNSTYGSSENWPPWLGIEICKNGALAGDQQLLVQKTSIMATLDEIKPLANKLVNFNESEAIDDRSNEGRIKEQMSNVIQKLQVDIPKFIIKSTSEQYFTLYVIILDLLFYTEPMSKILVDKLEKLRLSIDLQDFKSLHQRVNSLHKYHHLLKNLMHNYNFRRDFLDNEQYNDYSMLVSENRNTDTDIYLLMQSILTGDFYRENNDTLPKRAWEVRADEIILHMLEDDRKPILDIAIAKGNFKRIISEDGSNENRIEIRMMQGFNLIPGAYYQGLIEPYGEEVEITEDNLITVDWTMNRSIGGIKIMENFEIQAKPLNIKIDEITGEKLMKYIFRADSLDVDKSPVTKIGKASESETSSIKELGKKSENDFTQMDQSSAILEQFTKKDDSVTVDNDSNSNVKLNSKNSQSFYSDFSGNEYQENIGLMLERSNKYMSIISLKIGGVALMISIKLNKGFKRLMNVQDFLIHLPELYIENRFMSFLDIAMMCKKMIIRTLVSHSGSLLRNKLSIKKKNKGNRSKVIKPLEKYENFTNIADLT